MCIMRNKLTNAVITSHVQHGPASVAVKSQAVHLTFSVLLLGCFVMYVHTLTTR